MYCILNVKLKTMSLENNKALLKLFGKVLISHYCCFTSLNSIFLYHSFSEGISRFVPGITRAKIEKTYEIPQAEGGYRYHIRLANTNGKYSVSVPTVVLNSIFSEQPSACYNSNITILHGHEVGDCCRYS